MQFRTYANGKVAGFDISHILEMVRILGYDEYSMLQLLEYAEIGLQDAIKDLEET